MGKTLDKIVKEMNLNIHSNPGSKNKYNAINGLRKFLEEGEFNEQQYYIAAIKNRYNFEKTMKIINECNTYGHCKDPAKINVTNHGTYCNCTRCGMTYKRESSGQEIQEWNKMLHTQITI